MKKSARILLWSIGFTAFGALGLRFAALPYAEGKMLTVLNSAGFNEAVLERTSLGFYTLGYALRPKAGEEAVALLTLNPIASLLGRQLHLTSATLRLDNNWQVAGYAAGPSTEPAIKAIERPVLLPALPVVLDKLEVITPLGSLTGQLGYKGQQLSGTWQFMNYAGDLALLPEPEGAYALSIGAPAAPITFQLNLKGGRSEPVLSGNVSIAQQIVGPVSLQDIKVALNEGGKAGYALPYTASATLVGKPVEAKGMLDVLAQTVKGTAGGDIKVDSIDAVGVKLVYELTSLYPPVVKNGSTILATAIQAGGLPLITPRASFGFANNRVDLQSGTAGLFGGRVSLAPTQIGLPFSRVSVKANFEALDLSQVLQLAAVDGLGGEGKLSGSIPVTYNAGRITLGEAQLKAIQAGQIRYAPAVVPAFLAEGGSGAMLGQVFSDFQYSGLTMSLGGTLGDNLTLGARLEGNNPSFYNGHSVVLNLNLSGALESLLRDGLQSFQLSPEAIKQMSEEGNRP